MTADHQNGHEQDDVLEEKSVDSAQTEENESTESNEDEVLNAEIVEESSEGTDLQKEIEALKASELRIRADFDNFRRRTNEENAKRVKFASQSVIEKLIPLIDNFERALQVNATSEDAKQIQSGVDMIHRQLLDVLNAEQVEVIEAVGQPFDPNFHQAVMQEPSDEFESGIVTMELQKGYTMHGRVIRPSMVKVAE
ncbi:nucleotide exchange factor GrpE [Exiguobacterium profundum]|jgi:molecular chaperone GrpE|uniref:Protein GrpE n=2 Tax=Exiguobacterium TaxID=33986 RepID=C4L426_EXISA|nr:MULTISPECIES: nucleotide exchange factor GrpE [Exiguobacterium]QPI68751.1 nucleotide exchange factor GrpE [Exiguobacterium sp. PBE]ACQ69548.1 GrpE protein [Exiguobacterium sp. AT1b]MCM3279053.1 nucleotide exchange factor GrpE [Exiguobacterium sp. MER 193]MCT4797945.1 nucleotide exchange factor GrpE [Exiguobacterium profundum]QUP88204.1 nucleotide exchange factor GrpE [Exiguobacterium sp. PFWT01]